MRGVTAAADGGVTVNLSVRERDLLRSLPDQLRPLLLDGAQAPTLGAALFSRGYDDEEEERQYRELIGDDIVSQRTAALEVFARTLDEGTVTAGRWRATLDAEEAAAWLSAVNDGRLALGALVGITDESAWEDRVDDENPASVVLYYLGWLQEELVSALMESLPPSAA
jgi:hypothetical protein